MANTNQQEIQIVHELPIFRNVDRERLRDHVRDDMVTNFDSENMITHGREPEAVFVIMEGSADIYGVTETNKEILITDRHVNDIVGEQAFLDERKTTADVRARGRVKALKLREATFEELKKDAKFVWNLLLAVSAKLREATKSRTKQRLEQKMLLANFRAHVPQVWVDRILNGDEEAGQPMHRDAVIMFVDLRDFTDSCSRMQPDDIAEQLAPFFNVIVDAVHAHDGIVDKYIGDAVMAVWGHPALPNLDANRVFNAVQDMERNVDSLMFGGKAVRIGVGISRGTVFMGNVGTDDRRAFTVVGDAVNYAARYETLNKTDDGGEFLMTVGTSFYDSLTEETRAAFEPRGEQPVKGAPGGKQPVFSMKRKV
ncbi:MAG TPA: adenylate/guanylate cyclase domain-containing protein [Candidatus Tumulicola sp.]|nr:adenylate/guanylate cyclase domain-containing protein [Candidatus Tumulicola sp.]